MIEQGVAEMYSCNRQSKPELLYSLALGEIVCFHVRDDLYQDGRIDMHALRPVGRLAGHLYTHVHDIFEMKRPVSTYPG
jgi:hypothetical protein